MESPQDTLNEAEARFRDGDYAGAGAIFHRAWDAGNQQAGVRYASCLRLAGFARPALRVCRQLAQQRPTDLAVRTDSRKVTGSLTWEAGEWKGVLGALREAGALKSLEVWPE